jgi:hydroxymethylbilane synthase
METRVKLGTRGSPLALTQARMVAEALCAAHGWPEDAVAIVPIKTTGDKVQDRPLHEIGGKALWTKELEAALIDGRIDIAVHSMKDVETWRPETLAIVAMLPRADVRDRLVANGCDDFMCLAQGARLGTSSPRRAAQALHARPDLAIVPFRGNVDTRLSKLRTGEADATLLAAAGLDRLGRPDVGSPIPPELFLPAPAQGAIGIELRADDEATHALMAAVDHAPTSAAVHAERMLLAALQGSCRSPVAAHAAFDGGELILRAEILLPDGSERVAGVRRVPDATAVADLAAELLGRASPALRALFGG